MKMKRILLTLLVSLLAGCNLPGLRVAQPTPASTIMQPEAVFTLAMQTNVARSQTPPPATPTRPPTETAAPPPASTPSPVPSPSPTEILVTVPAPSVPFTTLYQYDFTRPGGWVRFENSDFAYGAVEGAYRIHVREKSLAVWSTRSGSLEDVRVEVDGSQRSGDAGSFYGVVCRHDTTGNNYYAFLAASDGTMMIAKRTGTEFVTLGQGRDQAGVIQGGGAYNRVSGECLGENLVLYVNGQKLLEAQDGDLSEGVAGIIAYSSPQGGIEAIFDNFALLVPEE